jgi:hypothetical protein
VRRLDTTIRHFLLYWDEVSALSARSEYYYRRGIFASWRQKYSNNFGACGRLRFIAILGFLTYSGILKKVTEPVSLFGAQESQRTNIYNAQKLLYRNETIRITQHARKLIRNKILK